MSKHTPGPWICQENRTIVSGSPLVTSRHHWIARANNNATLGKTNEDIRKYTEEANANARLIAAAPELLRAAQASKQLLVTLYPIFESIDKASTNTDYANGMKAIIGALKLVIEKAEGRE